MEPKAHYTAKELAGLPGMPKTEQAVNAMAKRESWPYQKRAGRGGGREYSLASLPEETRKALATRNTKVGYDEAPVLATATKHAAKLKQSADEKERLRQEARADSLAIFQRLPEKQQMAPNAKLAIIKACASYITDHRLAKTAGQRSFCHEYDLQRIDVAPWVRAEIPRCHPATLRSWIKDEYDLGMMGLINYYGNRKDQSKVETWNRTVLPGGEAKAPMADAIATLILANPHITEKKCNESLRALLPAAPKVSDKSVRRYMNKWMAKNRELHLYAMSPDDHKNRCQPAFGSRSEGITGIPNKLWEIDATPADLMLADGRYKIIGNTDVGTARVKLFVTRTERVQDNAAALRRCYLDWGFPWQGEQRTDQGSVYKSPAFTSLMSDLEIDHHICNAYSGDEKPHIERLFRTFSHDLVELMPSYIGHSVAERQRIEARKSFAERLLKPNEVIEMGMTGEELQAFCDRWSAIYHDTAHSRLTEHFGAETTPNQAFSRWAHPLRRISDERALDVLLYEPVRRGGELPSVQKKGIKVDGHHYIHAALEAHIGKKVRAYQDPANLGRIIVYLPNEAGLWAFLCIAAAPDLEVEGISRAEVATAARELHADRKRELARITREARRDLKKADLVEKVMALREQKAADARGNVTALPSRSVPFETPAILEASRAAAALEAPAAEIPQFGQDEIEAAGQRWIELMEQETKVVPLPTSHRPMFGTDLEKYKWLKAVDPTLWDFDDARWMGWYEHTTEYQLIFGEDEQQEER